MASVDANIIMEVGIEIAEPSWPTLCLVLSNHATRALACLECDRTDMAMESLRLAAAAIELSTAVVCRADLPGGCRDR